MSVQPLPAGRAIPRDLRFHGERRPGHGHRRDQPPLQLRDLPWWTAADQSEFEILVRALCMGIDWHLRRCLVAKASEAEGLPLWCKHLSGAVLEVVEWRDMREAYSRATYLRALLEQNGSAR